MIVRFLVFVLATTSSPALAGYAMYVWSTGFDETVAGCGEAELVAWDPGAHPACYTHNWESPASRQWLWDTANRPGREIDRLFVADIKSRLQAGHDASDCSLPEVQLVREMLLDGHCKVPGVKIHALLSTSDAAVSEQHHVPYVVWYNDECAITPAARFDGVAVNNEAWGGIKCTSPTAELAYLDDLQSVADAADLQVTGDLATHYSIGWHWGQCDGTDTDILWSGKSQPATHHMIDIFDSVDVQVATTGIASVASRATTAGYAHAVGSGKPFYVLSYTNWATAPDCSVTHFPYYCTFEWSNPRRTDEYLMEEVFDEFATNGIPGAEPGIHFFRAAYSTGAHADWPSYYSGGVATCIPVAFQGPVTFADPDDDGPISWPPQTNATVYELARSDGPIFDTGCKLVATSDVTVSEPERPLPARAFFYLVRVAAPAPGSWGTASDGKLRHGACLP